MVNEEIEFGLEGRAKEIYIQNLDTALQLLGKLGLPLRGELAEIRALLRTLGDNTDPLFETLYFDKENSGFPTYFQIMDLLSQKEMVLDKLEMLNSKLLMGTSSDYTVEPSVRQRGTLSEQVAAHVELNADLLAQHAQQNLLELSDSPRDDPEVFIAELAEKRARALFYHELFEGDHLVDSALRGMMNAKTGDAPSFFLMKTRAERIGRNARFSAWRFHVGAYARGTALFTKYIIDLYVKRGHEGKVARGRSPTRQFLRTLDSYVGLQPEVVYHHLVALQDIEPAAVTQYTIGPFYSSHMVSEQLPQEISERLRSDPDTHLLVSKATTVKRARRDVASIFGKTGIPPFTRGSVGSKKELTAPQPSEHAYYYIPSPSLEEVLCTMLDDARETCYVYTHRGDEFARYG